MHLRIRTRIFRRLKDYVIDNNLIEYDSKFEEIFSKFDSDDYLKNKLIFENHIYDAYSFLLDIFNEAKEEIIIIDKKIVYQLGSSLKDLGKKCSYISKFDNESDIERLIRKIDKLS